MMFEASSISQISALTPDEQVWRERAEDFVSRLRPVLDYASTSGISLSADQIAGLAGLEGLVSIVERGCLPLNRSGESRIATMPVDPVLTGPLRQYLGELRATTRLCLVPSKAGMWQRSMGMCCSPPGTCSAASRPEAGGSR